MRVAPCEFRMKRSEQIAGFPGFQDGHGLVFAPHRAQFGARIFGRDFMLQITVERQGEPLGRAVLQLEPHARGETQRAKQPYGLIRKTVNRKRADFAVLKNVGKPIGGVQQKPARCGVERNGDGIQGKIAAAEVFHNGGPPDFRGGARPGIDVVAGGGEAAIAVPGKNHLHLAQPLVFENNLRAALFQFAHQARRIAFDREVQVANGRSGNQVAHRAAGQIDVCARGRGKFLNAHHRRALLGGQPAF